MKPRILYYSLQPNDSTAWWRSSNVFPYIKSSDFDLVDISHIKAFSWNLFSGSSAIIMQRPFAQEHVGILAMAKDMNLKIILDYDDLLTDVPQENPTHQQYTANRPYLLDCMNLADEIWCSTPAIYDVMPFKSVVIPNAWNDFVHPIAEKRKFNPRTRKVIYRGGGSHMGDVYESYDLLLSVINSNLDYTFSFMGDRYTALEVKCGDNYHILAGQPITQYFKHFFAENSNIAIFPLMDNKFNRAKSNISFLEAVYSGAAFFGNKNLPEFNFPFVLSMEDLPLLLRDYKILEQANERSWEYICDTLLLSNVNKLRAERIKANL